MERFFDIVLSLIAVLVLSPLFLVVIVSLKLSGEGEIFYFQSRVGKNGIKFKLFKFATMLKNSENIGTGTITVSNDPRVLPFGKFLRRTKINELPQLFNIILGDMSIVGPRPQTERCFNAFPIKSQNIIKKMKPGLSGLGSLVFRNEDQMMADNSNANQFYDEEIMPYKGAIEEYFFMHKSFADYFKIILLTILIMVFPKSTKINFFYNNLPKAPETLKKYILL